MDQITNRDYKEQLDALHRAGLTSSEIHRLCRFRQFFRIEEADRSPAEVARLRFVRWLVEQGRLSEQTG